MDEKELTAVPVDELRRVLKSQYHAALAMFRDTIERCPEDLWYSEEHTNAFWQIAYHTLYFTHLYLQPNFEAFQPWKGHQANVQHFDGLTGPRDPESTLPLIPEPYEKGQVLEYWGLCDRLVDEALDSFDLLSPESGFDWYQMSKLEHQINNIRHVQHHLAQLADRLRSAAGSGTRWMKSESPAPLAGGQE